MIALRYWVQILHFCKYGFGVLLKGGKEWRHFNLRTVGQYYIYELDNSNLKSFIESLGQKLSIGVKCYEIWPTSQLCWSTIYWFSKIFKVCNISRQRYLPCCSCTKLFNIVAKKILTDSTKINRPGHNIRMYWTNFRQPTAHIQKNIFGKTCIEVFSPHLYASFGTFYVKICPLFEVQWVFDVCLKIDN